MISLKKAGITLLVAGALVLTGCKPAEDKAAPAGAPTEQPAGSESSAAAPTEGSSVAPAGEGSAPVSGELTDLQKQVDEMNKAFESMPANDQMKMVARLDSSDANKPTIIMETQMLKIAADSKEAAAMKAMNAQGSVDQQMQQLCADPQMKPLIEKKVSYKIKSTDKDGGELNSIEMNLGECK